MAVTDPSYAGQVTTQISRVDPEVEAMRRGLLRDVQTYFRGFDRPVFDAAGQPVMDPTTGLPKLERVPGALERGYPQMPVLDAQGNPVIDPATGQPKMQAALDYRIAPMSETEKEAIGAARAGIGAFQPFLSSGETAIQGGQNILTAGAIPALQQGIATLGGGLASLAGTGATFDPTRAASFMSPYETAAVQQALGDIQRQGDIAQQGLRAQAVGAGAFGGSRQAIAEQELQRNVMEQQGRTAAQMRAAGYESAASRAQQAFEQALGRQLTGVGLVGQLGQGIGSLAGQYGQFGTQMGQLGVQQAGIGEIGQNLLSSQLQNALAAGGLERGINQSALEAARMSNLQRQTYPLQQFGYLSDIYSGIPTASSVMTASTAPSVSPFQTAVGLGISGLSAAAGAQKAGLF
jgi:hypothetical protein